MKLACLRIDDDTILLYVSSIPIDDIEDITINVYSYPLQLIYKNIEFIKGDIENMPIPENSYDVVISNCVLNLVPDKQKAFSEIFRILKTGGHFCVSDIVLEGILPAKLQEAAVLYAGCIPDDWPCFHFGFSSGICCCKLVVVPSNIVAFGC